MQELGGKSNVPVSSQPLARSADNDIMLDKVSKVSEQAQRNDKFSLTEVGIMMRMLTILGP